MNPASSITKHTAPGQYLGYALQPVRLCYHLLTSPEGARVSLEHLDDVAVENIDGSSLLEQTKSATTQNPLSDWASDLWKTIDFWREAIETNALKVESARFLYYVTPTKAGVFAEALSQATTEIEVKGLIDDLESRLAKQPTLACAPHVKRLLAMDAALRQTFVAAIKVASVDDDPVDPLRDLFKLTVSPVLVDPICHWAIGAAKEMADRLIREKAPAILDADQFRAEVVAFVQKNNLPSLLTSFSIPPPTEAIAQLLKDRPVFLRQLELVDLDEDTRVRAVSDFLRTSADISFWGERGMIFERNLEDWNDHLIARQHLLAGEIADTLHDKPAEMRGRTVYRRCAALEPPLDGRAVPGHFVNGSFNALADVSRLGWHPDYQTLLDQKT